MKLTGKIHNGDVLDHLRILPADSVDLVVTSPPYADARVKQYGGPPPEKYVRWYAPIARALKRVVKPTGCYVLNVKEKVVDGQRSLYVYDLVKAHVRAGWRWYDEVIWRKPNAFPTGRLHLRDAWEHCYLFSLAREPYIDRAANRRPLNPATAQARERARARGVPEGGDKEYPSGMATTKLLRAQTTDVAPDNVIDFGTGGNTGAVRAHPAAFPLGLPEWFVRMLCPPDGHVLDPFGGSGTTAIAAERHGRHWTLIEKSPEYCHLAQERIDRDRRRRLAHPADVPAAQKRLDDSVRRGRDYSNILGRGCRPKETELDRARRGYDYSYLNPPATTREVDG